VIWIAPPVVWQLLFTRAFGLGLIAVYPKVIKSRNDPHQTRQTPSGTNHQGSFILAAMAGNTGHFAIL